MLENLPVNNFEWVQDISQLSEDFIKNYNQILKKVMKNIFL